MCTTNIFPGCEWDSIHGLQNCELQTNPLHCVRQCMNVPRQTIIYNFSGLDILITNFYTSTIIFVNQEYVQFLLQRSTAFQTHRNFKAKYCIINRFYARTNKKGKYKGKKFVWIESSLHNYTNRRSLLYLNNRDAETIMG